mmetsp:Transcript_26135/g.50764  ORF Transcript_26135/g.50764 Transcript_26135/m.50764 type:complete len:295 (-) Transcript_26135:312-1196(-)
MADKACGQTTSIFMKPALSLRLAALVGIAVVIAALFPSTPILPSPTLLAWSCAQVGQALAPFSVPALARVEAWAWSRWERSVQQKHSAIPLPVLSPDSEPTLSSPFVLRGLLNASEAFASFATTEWLQRPPIGDIRIHYFSNASRKQLVTPDSTGRVADVVAAIARGGPQKIGTESVIRAFPELLRDLPLPPLLTKWFGSNEFLPHRVGRTLTVPIFLATGAPHAGLEARTELHAEPIGNVMLMLSGSKRWTLISPAESHLLRPTIAPDGARRTRATCCGSRRGPGTASPTSQT